MITLVVGENTFENERALTRIAASFEGLPEKVDSKTLELKHLPDLLMSGTLFATNRLVIIKNLSENKTLWTALPEWLERLSDEVHLVLVESKPDKRTKTYKELHKHAAVQESKLWSDRDGVHAQQWVVEEAKSLGFTLDKKNAQSLVARVGVDQWLLFQALQKLAVLEEVTPAIIEEVIEAQPAENVFNLFEAALKGDTARVKKMLGILETTEEPYRLFALLSTQAFQLAALAATNKSSAAVATDLGAHPFALSKLAPYAKKLGRPGTKKIIVAFAEADTAMKTSAAEPWLLIERALHKVSSV